MNFGEGAQTLRPHQILNTISSPPSESGKLLDSQTISLLQEPFPELPPQTAISVLTYHDHFVLLFYSGGRGRVTLFLFMCLFVYALRESIDLINQKSEQAIGMKL